MSRNVAVGVVAAALLAAGLIGAALWLQSPHSAGPPVQNLMAEWTKLNASCRGGSGDDAYTHQACAEREMVDRQLAAQGWCYGEGKTLQHEMGWRQCSQSTTAAPLQPREKTTSDIVEFSRDRALRRERLELIASDTRSCMHRMARTQLTIGNRDRSDLIIKMVGICGRAYELKRLAFGYVQPKQEMDGYLWQVANRALDVAVQEGQ